MEDRLADRARELLREFKGSDYAFGTGALEKTGELTRPQASKVALVTGKSAGPSGTLDAVTNSLKDCGVEVVTRLQGANPNTPIEDIRRMAGELAASDADAAVGIGGGSLIDATKMALVLADIGGDVKDYFGAGKVSAASQGAGKEARPLIAVQTASASAAHLTRYANATDMERMQKSFVADDAIVPPAAVFDYSVTRSMSREFTCDGAFDGLSHLIEVYYGSSGMDAFGRTEEVVLAGMRLIMRGLAAVASGNLDEAREPLGLGTDLGGYAIMLCGTNGGHLASYSLVDVLPHGRACAIMNMYYTSFFAPAIAPQLDRLAGLLAEENMMKPAATDADPVALGEAVAGGLMQLARSVGFPTSLGEIEGAGDHHIQRALAAAKQPELRMKLQNMPVPMTTDDVDEYMGSVWQAAMRGDLGLVKHMRQS